MRRLLATMAMAPVPRLLLTSSGLTTPQIERTFASMLADAARDTDAAPSVAYVATAAMAPNLSSESKRSPGELRRRRWADARRKAREIERGIGVPVECVDAARDAEAAAAAIERCPCCWVAGGNTFYLWHHMRRAGLDAVVRERVGAGALYVGQSAGAIIAGADISTAHWKGWDDPRATLPDEDWSTAESVRGMGLAAPCFFPHYDPTYSELVASRRAELGGNPLALLDEAEAWTG